MERIFPLMDSGIRLIRLSPRTCPTVIGRNDYFNSLKASVSQPFEHPNDSRLVEK